MGLMICRNLVHLNDGEILVHSDGEDKGARFTFTMKMSKPEDEMPGQLTGETGSLPIIDKKAATSYKQKGNTTQVWFND